jgi:predicted 2-oxoglutarate/Fe(II)-dependent dioxygenase YbiX
MSRDNDPKEFTAIFNHELIHSYHYSLNLDKKMSENQFMSYTEHIAYQYYYDNGFRNLGIMNNLNTTTTGAYHIYMPSGLIPLPK